MQTVSQEAMLKTIEAIANRIGMEQHNGVFPSINALDSVNAIADRINALTQSEEQVTFMQVADALLDVATSCAIGVASMVAGAEVNAVTTEVQPQTTDALDASARVDQIMKNLQSAQ